MISTAESFIGKFRFSFCKSDSILSLSALSREFHYGAEDAKPKHEHETPHVQQIDNRKKGTQPPESTFKKLGPSNQRYTILNQRDEL